MFIGVRSDITKFYQGRIDEVGIENIVLNSTDISSIYQNGFPLFNDSYPGFSQNPFTVTRTTEGDTFIVDVYGDVGIKNPNPGATLDVNGSGKFTTLQVSNDLFVGGTIIGGSPVKISGGLIVTGGDINASEVNASFANMNLTRLTIPSGGDIHFSNQSSFILYNDSTERVELWANGVLQQDWGNSTTIYGKATFQADAFFQNLSGEGLFINTNVLVDGNITAIGYGNFTDVFAGNICYSDGTNCTYINSTVENVTIYVDVVNETLWGNMTEMNDTLWGNLTQMNITFMGNLSEVNDSLNNDYYNKTEVDANFTLYRLISVLINASEVNKTSGTYYLNQLLDTIIDTLALNINTVNLSVQYVSQQTNETYSNLTLVNNTVNNNTQNINTLNSSITNLSNNVTNQFQEVYANLSEVNSSLANATVNYSYYSNYSGFANYSNYAGYSDESNYSNYSGYSDTSGQSNYSNYSNYSTYAGQAQTSVDSNYSNYSNFSEYINEARYNLTVINNSIRDTNLNLTNHVSEIMANL
jgi:hypothetical protein